MKNLLTIESLSRDEILAVLADTAAMKSSRGHHASHPLRHQCWALIFSKSSTRTRVSFEVGIRELGGDPMFLAAADIQLGRGEPIKDTARVMGRMLHGAVIRTFAQKDVEDFAEFSGIPTINALTDEEHPCQILADLFTIRESRGSLDGLKVAFIGDGDCNVSRSWIWAAARLGFELVIAAPKKYQPCPELLARAGGSIHVTDGDHPYMSKWWVPGLQIGYEHTFVHQVADFMEGVGSGHFAGPTFRDALETQYVCDAVLASAKSGQWNDVKHAY